MTWWGRGAYTLLLDGGAVPAQDELLGSRCEVWETSNGQILVVEIRVAAQDLVGLVGGVSTCQQGSCESYQSYRSSQSHGTHLLDNRQDPGLCIVISVGSNAQVDLFWVSVAAIGGHQPKERVFWRLRHCVCVEGCRSHWCYVCGDLLQS